MTSPISRKGCHVKHDVAFNLEGVTLKMNRLTGSSIFSKRLRLSTELSVIAFIALMARSSSISALNWASDDYSHAFNPPDQFSFWLSQGRWVLYCINAAAVGLGASIPFVGGLWGIAEALALAVLGLLLRHFWDPGAPSVIGIAVGSIVALSPYATDLMSYNINGPWFIVCILSSAGVLFLLSQHNNQPSSLIVVLALIIVTSYQALALMIAAIFVIDALVKLGGANNGALEDGRRGIPMLAHRLLLLFVAVAVNALITMVICAIAEQQLQARGQIVGISEIPVRLMAAALKIYDYWACDESSVPRGAKLLQIFLLGVVIVGIVIRFFKCTARNWVHRFFAAWAALMALCFSICIPVVPYFALRENTGLMTPRMMLPLTITYAGMLCVSYAFCPRGVRGIICALGVMLCISYALKVNEQSADFSRVNIRDRLLASRMIERFSTMSDYKRMRTAVFVGDMTGIGESGIRTRAVSFNDSAFVTVWSRVGLLNEVGSLNLSEPTANDIEMAKLVARGRPHWPAGGSAFIQDEVGIIVVGEE
ncbi:MAG: glucosyltransferase domain-containing protein [Chthoniobacterales bacterium]|nr:glucosyltransferase domain-containing protein [Chthoniobacterales bacterium]